MASIVECLDSGCAGNPMRVLIRLTAPINPIRLAVNLWDLQTPTGYLTRPITQPTWRMSLRRIFPMTAIALLKAWIAFRAYKW